MVPAGAGDSVAGGAVAGAEVAGGAPVPHLHSAKALERAVATAGWMLCRRQELRKGGV